MAPVKNKIGTKETRKEKKLQSSFYKAKSSNLQKVVECKNKLYQT